jgi:hypothetical protein
MFTRVLLDLLSTSLISFVVVMSIHYAIIKILKLCLN